MRGPASFGRLGFRRWSGWAVAAALTLEAVPSQAQTLNPTGRDVALTAPLREGGRVIGEVTLFLSASDEIRVETRSLAAALAEELTAEGESRLNALGDAAGRVTPADLQREGFELTYNPSDLALDIVTPGSARRLRSLTGSSYVARPEAQGAPPTDISAYVNARARMDLSERDWTRDALERASLSLNGAIAIPQLGHAVIEGEAGLDGSGEVYLGGARAVYDEPESMRRWRAGMVSTPTLGVEGAENALALQVLSRNFGFDDRRLVAATGLTSFLLERRSEVRIRINGVVARSFLLEPGNYDLRDFDLSEGFNNVVVEIEDDLGIREILNFDAFRDRRLRRPGDKAYAVTAGVIDERRFRDQFEYGDAFVAGFYETGVTEKLTLGGYAKASPSGIIGGVTGSTPLGNGLLSFEAAASAHDAHEPGVYGALGWTMGVGELRQDRLARSLSLLARARTEDFGGSLREDANNHNDYGVDLSLNYGQTLGDSWRMSLGADARLVSFEDEKDSYGVRLGLSRSFGIYGVSADVGYRFGDEDEFSANLRVSYDFDDLRRAELHYDVDDRNLRATYRQRSETRGVGAWAASATAQHDFDQDLSFVGGSASYIGNRAVARLSHDTALRQIGTADRAQRTSLEVETALAYAGGRFGVGRPIQDSFALVYPHRSLGDAQIHLNTREADYQARSGWLGAAVAHDLDEGRGQFVSYDAPEAPPGYDLGTGVFDVKPTYRSGYALQVGSPYSVTAVGEFRDAYDEPVSLRAGEARALDDPAAPVVTVFTNRVGRFVAQGLGPGRWRVTLPGEPELRYSFAIPEDATGLVRIDILKPEP